MYTLFISTYNELITLGLVNDNKLIDQKEQLSNHSHSIYLVPLIDQLLTANNLIPQDLKQIIVVNGPGSFTGIRLGITVAKTLAYTLNIPIKTITSIEAIACSIHTKNKIITIDDNKGKYIGIFENNNLVNLFYLKEEEANEFLKDKDNVYTTEKLNINNIYNYALNLPEVNAHAVKAAYIKEIEALNGK